MSVNEDILDELLKLELTGCGVDDKGNVGFTAQDFDDVDPLEPRLTVVYFYMPARLKANRWVSMGQNSVAGISTCFCPLPDDAWIFVNEPGEVFRAGGGEAGYELDISDAPVNHFTSAKCISGGKAYVAGLHRQIFRRDAPNTWTELSTKRMRPRKSGVNVGFTDVDGFSDSDIYACGGHGDLWHFDGKKWLQEDVPTDALLEKLLCTEDGRVIVTTNSSTLLIGERSKWRVVAQEREDDIYSELVEYQSRVLVATDDDILELKGDQLESITESMPNMTSYSHLAASDEVLVVGGSQEAFMMMKGKWQKIFQAG